MAEKYKIKKVTDFPEASTLDGFYAFGTDGSNNSVKVPIGMLRGNSPHIGANGNWYVGDIDLGVHAQGVPGEVSQAQFDTAINSITASLPEGDLILTIPTWTQGGLNSDGTVSPSNNIIHSDYIGIGSYIKKVNFMSGYQLSILEYNSAGTQLQYTVLTEPAVNGFTLLTNTDKIRLVYQKTPTGTTPPSAGANVKFGLGEMNFGVWQRGIPTEPTLYNRIHGQQAYVNARSLKVTFPSNCICYIWEVTATGTTSYKTLTASTDNHALKTDTVKVYPVFGLSTGGTIDTSFAKYLTVKENLSQSFGQTISRSEVEELLQDVGTSANSNGVLLFKGHDIFDYSGKFPMVDITNDSRDKSFPVCLSKGNQVILNYIDRENHNSTVTNNVVRVSNDGGLTFSGELILNDLKLTAGVRLKGKNKILASKIYFDNPSDPIMTKPVIADFETLISSNFTSGFEIKDALTINGLGTAELVMSSGAIEHKGILYWAGYRDTSRTTGANNAQAGLFKSLDYGETWVFVSFVPQKPTNEFAICFVGDRLIGSTRVSDGKNVDTQNNWVFYSDDYGVTWTSVRLNINIHNPYMFAWNGHPVLAGRLIMTDYPRSLGFVVLNTDGTIKSVIIFDKQSIASLSYHQGYMIAGEYLRVFGHLYTDTTNNHSKIFRMDIPLNVLNSLTNFGTYF